MSPSLVSSVVLGAIMNEGYGMTETSGAAMAALPIDKSVGIVGVPFPGLEVGLRSVGDMG